MPRSYRCIILAAFGWLILAASPLPGQSPGNKHADTDPAVQPSSRDIAAAIQKQNEPSRNDQPCDKGKEDRHSNLCAQWKAADAAETSSDIALWSLIAGGVIGLLTLAAATAAAYFARIAALETKRSADFAGRMAFDSSVGVAAAVEANKAMREANEIARETQAAELRAYLDFDGVGFVRDPSRDNGDNIWSGIYIKLRNFGHTPAKQIVMETTYLITGTTMTTHKVAFDTDKQFSYIVPTDVVTSNGEFAIPRPIWDAVAERKAKVTVEAKVAFTDYRGDPHHLACVFESNGIENEFGFVAGTRSAD
jgi:hypothetical protein